MTAPIRSTQFRKGQSGNPRGRPRKGMVPEAGSVLDVFTDRELTVTSNGVERSLPVQEALQLRTYQDALAGKTMAIRTVLKWIAKRDAAVQAARPQVHVTIERKIEAEDPVNADDALLILEIASSHVDPHWPKQRLDLRLETWAVQRALSRRTGAALTERERHEIERCTREPATIRWPRSRQQ